MATVQTVQQMLASPIESPAAGIDISGFTGENIAPVWVTLNQWLPSRSRSLDFWWQVSGCHLATMLHEAGYLQHRQYECLLFYYYVIVPGLGPAPTSAGTPIFRSFMTDDYSPIEYSWRWGDSNAEPPAIRLSVELIGMHAGTAKDPYNQMATVDLMAQLHAAVPSIDLTWFWQFLPSVAPGPDDAATVETEPYWGSSLFTAYELGADTIDVKAYFVPRSKHARDDFLEHGFQRAAERVWGAGSPLVDFHVPAWEALSTFLRTSDDGQRLQMKLVGIDCAAPAKARVKIYMRTAGTSLAHTLAILSLGGARPLATTVVADIRALWRATLGLNETGPDVAEEADEEELPVCVHETTGVLFYFSIQPGAPWPDVKVYIPVRHYGQSDTRVANGLVRFLEAHDRAAWADRYQAMLRGFSSEGTLVKTRGLHTYISFGVQRDGKLQITSYFSPQIYQKLAGKTAMNDLGIHH